MNQSKTHSVLLFLSGLIGLVVGIGIGLTPHDFYKSYEVTIGNDINTLNEMRAFGGQLFGAGIFILVGTFVTKFRQSAAILATVIYGSFGIARILSALIDGVPHINLLIVAIFEFIFGLLNLVMFLKSRNSSDL